jgi:transcriptional regulator with XRE-family HTH domain
VACDDPVAEVARLLALRLGRALGGRSLREAGRVTGVDHTTVGDILAGRVWADIATLARLEAGLGADLWPGQGRGKAKGPASRGRPRDR